jgi:hypothetical protein
MIIDKTHSTLASSALPTPRKSLLCSKPQFKELGWIN